MGCFLRKYYFLFWIIFMSFFKMFVFQGFVLRVWGWFLLALNIFVLIKHLKIAHNHKMASRFNAVLIYARLFTQTIQRTI